MSGLSSPLKIELSIQYGIYVSDSMLYCKQKDKSKQEVEAWDMKRSKIDIFKVKKAKNSQPFNAFRSSFGAWNLILRIKLNGTEP